MDTDCNDQFVSCNDNWRWYMKERMMRVPAKALQSKEAGWLSLKN